MAFCKSCAAQIKWIQTTNGKMMPVNAKLETFLVVKPDAYGEEFGHIERGYISHFTTCPHADRHRKRKK